jgi:mRNA interferase MazF
MSTNRPAPGPRPKTGEIYEADLGPGMPPRPVAIFQAPDLERFAPTVLCVPLTTIQDRLGTPGTCLIPKKDSGLKKDYVALAYQLRALDKTRLREKVGQLPAESIEALADAILGALGIAVE